MSCVLVTTGATVTFEELINLAFEDRLLETLKSLGYNKLIIQYGKPQLGARLFKQRLQQYHDTYGQDIAIEGFAFSSDISSVISRADLVISHAGTGSILDTLRLNKKLIVVINSRLMDNHQLEIANELSENGYLLKSTTNIQDLISKIEQVPEGTLKNFPSPRKNIIEAILHNI